MKSPSPADGGYRHVLRIVLPMVMSNAAFTVMQFTDRVLLSRYASEAIQAAMPAGMLSFTMMCFFATVAGYSGTFVAQYHGAGDARACVRACMAGLFLAFAALPACLLLIPICSWLVRIAGHAPAIQALENEYTFWMLLGGVPMAMHWVLGGYLTGRNHVVINAVVTIVGCAANIVLDIALIFGRWGFPALGLRGAGIATFASSVFGSGLLLAVVLLDRDVRSTPWRERMRPGMALVRRIVRFGVPAGIQNLFDVGSFTFFVMLTGRLDALSLATSNIAFSINNLAISPLFGFGNAASVLVGQFQGAGQPTLARKAGWHCLHLAWVYMAAIAAVFLIFPVELLELFRSADAEYTVAQMTDLGRKLLFLMAVWGMFDTMNVLLMGALKGAGDTHFVMLTLTLGGWLVWIPSELVILNGLGLGILGAWTDQLVYIVLLSLVFLARWVRGRWAEIRMIG